MVTLFRRSITPLSACAGEGESKYLGPIPTWQTALLDACRMYVRGLDVFQYHTYTMLPPLE